MKKKDTRPRVAKTAAAEGGEVALHKLLEAMLSLRTAGELHAFLEDLCTPAELEAIADRWRVVPLLIEQVPYRDIHDRTGVSVTTIGRIARCLGHGAGGYRIAAARVLGGPDSSSH
ncbi:MAG TPA: YerC/YecD family TrpR-related protein [Arenimonas sp.]|uniref:YerC/YecD family TrpR-related protein n=1 Tax=Arenimonas sp. TaxID=1872635 RepID=UPI002C4B79AF|nr:YerC/YecD family TrpR-related protein [Arenimonas sp.]HMB57491.1 YerC/YecD family TrpR-related protein [Arenimonas sp.]